MDPITGAAAISAGGALAGGGLSFLGANSQAKNIRKAMQDYVNYVEGQRSTFLNQKESGAIRDKLGSYIGGEVGYSDGILNDMKSGVREDYGKSLADMTRLTAKSGTSGGGVMTPGRADRTSRLLGQNIAANRATSMRDINTKNADVALSNQRFAVSALPTYMPGLPATPTIGPDVFAKMNEAPHWGSFMGPAVSQAGAGAGQMMMMGPIMQKMLEAQNPYNAAWATNLAMNNGLTYYNTPESDYIVNTPRLFPTR